MRQIRFRFDGQPINETDTPAQVSGKSWNKRHRDSRQNGEQDSWWAGTCSTTLPHASSFVPLHLCRCYCQYVHSHHGLITSFKVYPDSLGWGHTRAGSRQLSVSRVRSCTCCSIQSSPGSKAGFLKIGKEACPGYWIRTWCLPRRINLGKRIMKNYSFLVMRYWVEDGDDRCCRND